MKKIGKLTMLILLCAMMVVAAAACGTPAEEEGGEDNGKIYTMSGAYEPTTIVLTDGTETAYTDYISDMLAEQGIVEGTESYETSMNTFQTVYDIHGDGTLTATMGGVAVEGTYSFGEGSEGTMTVNNVELSFTFDSTSNVITIHDGSGVNTVLERQQ